MKCFTSDLNGLSDLIQFNDLNQLLNHLHHLDHLNQFKSDLNDLIQFIKTDSTNADVFAKLGVLKYEIGDTLGGCKFFQRAVDLGDEKVADVMKQSCK